MDGESIRNKLLDVFGTFDDFCQQISNTGPLSTRHGVVTPVTPVALRANSFASSKSRTPPPTTSQSARSCIQTMSELVDDSPILPLHIASFNRELYQDPSSSTRSAPDDNEIGKRRDRRRNRNPDSDSEFEKDISSRKRHTDHITRPGTSRAIQEDDAMKELFGDDTAKPNGSEKAISPDSGVHSNEGSDETDVQTIISTMSNLLPMLSPITDRPRDKEAQRKENERKQKKAAEQKRREEEKQKEQEEKEKRRRNEREAAKKAEKEKKEAEERERMRKEAERKKEEERIRKEMQERKEKQKRDEEKRKEEERLKNEEKQKMLLEERKREEKRKEIERQREEQRKLEERLRADEQERVRAAKEVKQENFEDVPSPSDASNSSNRLKGMLPLHKLSSEKLAQLMDMSKNLKSENKGSRPSSPLLPKMEKEEKAFAAEADIGRRNLDSSKLDIKNIPSPRMGVGTARRDCFHCASNECIPQKPTLPIKSKEAEVSLADSYHELARCKKRQADANEDLLCRILLYMESMAYFSLAAYQYSLGEKSNGRHVSIMRDTSRLIETVTVRFLNSDSRSPLEKHFTSRVRAISLRAQSVLGYHVFNYKLPNSLKMHTIIERTEKKLVQQNAEAFNSQSPGNSGSSHTSASSNIIMPMEVFNNYKVQLRQLHGLMFAHKQWNDSTAYIAKSSTDTLFVNTLESICGTLSITMAIDKMAISVLTGITWLRDEYEIERKRPQPSQ